MPINVVWFERLAYASLGLGLLDLALDFQNLSRLSPAINLIGTLVLTLGVIALLIWLVARRRQGWARWAFLVLYLFGLPFFFMNLMQQSLLSVPISLLQVVLQGVALFFVFTGDAKTWFAQPQSAPLLDMPMPKSVERFEQLGYVGLILAIVATLFDLIDAARAPQSSVTKAILGLLEILAIGIGWLLIWLIARRRQGWARWAFLGFVLVLLAHLVLTFGRSPIWADGLNGLQMLAWLAGASLSLMDEARPWFEATPHPPPRRRSRRCACASPRVSASSSSPRRPRFAGRSTPTSPRSVASGCRALSPRRRRSSCFGRQAWRYRRRCFWASCRCWQPPPFRPRSSRCFRSRCLRGRPSPSCSPHGAACSSARSSPPTTVTRRAIWHSPPGSTISRSCPLEPAAPAAPLSP